MAGFVPYPWPHWSQDPVYMGKPTPMPLDQHDIEREEICNQLNRKLSKPQKEIIKKIIGDGWKLCFDKKKKQAYLKKGLISKYRIRQDTFDSILNLFSVASNSKKAITYRLKYPYSWCARWRLW